MARKARFIEVACWATHGGSHASSNGSDVAEDLLKDIGELFMLEREINRQRPEARLAARQQYAVPVMDPLRMKLEPKILQCVNNFSAAGAYNA